MGSDEVVVVVHETRVIRLVTPNFFPPFDHFWEGSDGCHIHISGCESAIGIVFEDLSAILNSSPNKLILYIFRLL